MRFLFLFIFIGLVNAGLLKRWQYDNGFDPDEVTDYNNGYDWKIQKYWKWPLSSGQPPHFVVMAQPFYQNGDPVPFVETPVKSDGGFSFSSYKGFVYSFELYPAGDIEGKGGSTVDGVDTFVSGYKRVSPSWTATGAEIELQNWSPNQLVSQFGSVSDESFSDGKPYFMPGSTFGKGQNCLDFANVFFNKLSLIAKTAAPY
jgi:hypothetical protein